MLANFKHSILLSSMPSYTNVLCLLQHLLLSKGLASAVRDPHHALALFSKRIAQAGKVPHCPKNFAICAWHSCEAQSPGTQAAASSLAAHRPAHQAAARVWPRRSAWGWSGSWAASRS